MGLAQSHISVHSFRTLLTPEQFIQVFVVRPLCTINHHNTIKRKRHQKNRLTNVLVELLAHFIISAHVTGLFNRR